MLNNNAKPLGSLLSTLVQFDIYEVIFQLTLFNTLIYFAYGEKKEMHFFYHFIYPNKIFLWNNVRVWKET